MRDIFGRLLGDPSTLDLPGRVDCLRRLGGELQAGGTPEAAWLGRTLLAWLHDGGDLAERLGVRTPRGSRMTPQALVRQAAQDSGLLRLAREAGGDRQASRILRGVVPCPGSCVDLVDELRTSSAPSSVAAIRRARERASRHR